jgi:dipeptidyl aminopeptidase/acylaminoacyl peptidase
MKRILLFTGLLVGCLVFLRAQEENNHFEFSDVFLMEYVSDPQISPNGQEIVYVRNSMDVYTDGAKSHLWHIRTDGRENRPLTSGNNRYSSPRWSPDGKMIAFISNRDRGAQIYIRWMDTGHETQVTNLAESPANLTWSPDGKFLLYNMRTEAPASNLVNLPKPPKGAEWAAPPKYITKMNYKADGAGFLRDVYQQVFILQVENGYSRQLTKGEKDHAGPFSWSSDGKFVYFSSNLHEDRDFEPRNSEVYKLDIANGQLMAITNRKGPDQNPKVSPDGRWLAYTGNDENYMGYQVTELYISALDGSNPRSISADLDRDVSNVYWSGDSKTLFFQYDSEGETRIASIDLNGKRKELTKDVGGLSFGRPYGGGTFSAAPNGNFAFTLSSPYHPAELGVYVSSTGKVQKLTTFNEGLFSHKQLGEIEEIWYSSSFDGLDVQGWICKPPGFDPSKKYPLLLEIHGGPFANYGPRFAAEIQLYAAAGYVVLYTNPRGSTSYGDKFANYIHHNYPSQDYDDLISGVDALIARGYIDEDNLFVTGGSGGGVLTAWIVGKTDRFRAAVVAKPVINWTSHVLHADGPAFFARYWFGKYPWEDVQTYWDRSPLSLVGNVTTPTMLLTGEQDLRTPMSETEQYYAALKLNKVETAMVRIQEASHGYPTNPAI